MVLPSLPRAGADVAPAERHVPEPRLVKAAHHFEAIMMKELLAPMAQSGDLFSDQDRDQNGILCEFASESLAGALSAGGGLGIANRIVEALSHSGNSSRTPGVIGKLKTDFGLSVSK